MIEIIGGLLMMSGGGLLVGASIPLARGGTRVSAEVAAALPYTPVVAATPPDMQALLDALH